MTALFLRDLKLAFRGGGGALTGMIFFLAVIAVVPFGVGPDLKLLARIGPAIIWIGALLAALLGLDRLFQADREDGSLDVMILRGDFTSLAAAAPCCRRAPGKCPGAESETLRLAAWCPPSPRVRGGSGT